MSVIEVSYEVTSTAWHNRKTLEYLSQRSILSFDIETKGVYSRDQRKLALSILKDGDIDIAYRKLASLIGHNSGLSFPSLVDVTHFVFSISNSISFILITSNAQEELAIWKWVAEYPGLLLIHNTLFDLKVMYHRIRKFPHAYEDTALMAKVLINDSDIWKAKIALKELMGSFYDPSWTLIDGYEPENPRDPSFLRYASIDGAATYKLYELLQEQFQNEK